MLACVQENKIQTNKPTQYMMLNQAKYKVLRHSYLLKIRFRMHESKYNFNPLQHHQNQNLLYAYKLLTTTHWDKVMA